MVKENTQNLRKNLTQVWREEFPNLDVRRIHTNGIGSEEAQERAINSGFDIITIKPEDKLRLTGSSRIYELWGRPIENLKAEQKRNSSRRPKDTEITPVDDD